MTHIALHDFATLPALQTERPPMLVDPWLAAGSITLLFGPPSAGKTHLTVSMAEALCTGTPLWGIYPTQKSRVLVVQADMNTALYQERTRTTAARLVGAKALVTDAMPIDVLALRPTHDIVKALRDFAPDIVFVDTLRKTHMLDEIDSTTPDKVYAAWRALLPGAAFVFLHHSRKVASDPKKQMDVVVREAFRGSGAWAASADTIIMQKRARKANNSDWLTRLYFVRTRSCAEPRSILLRLNDELMLEPLAESPAEQALLAWASANPRAKRSEGIEWLVKEGHCSQATAYRTWDRILKGDG